MKKFIVLILFGLMIVGFSTMVYAQKLEFKASGSIDFATVWEMNVPFYFASVSVNQAGHTGLFQTWTTPSFYASTAGAGIAGHRTAGLDRPAAYWYSRGVLRFDAVMSKELSGTIIFEIDALRWGQQTAGSLTQASMRNNMGAWATDQAAVEVKNVYIDFGLPYFGIPVPMTVRVGAIPFGVRPNMVLYTDGMGITGGINVDPVMIIPMWGKMLEGTDYAADDADMYGLHVNAKLGTFTVGGYGLNYNMNTYPLQWNTAVAGVASASYGTVIAGTQKADFWWLGAYVDGKAGPVNINFDFVYDRGKVESRQTPTAEDVKYRGWATRGKIDFPWEKFNFGGTFMYASGADASKTSISGLPGTAVADPSKPSTIRSSKVRSYVVPPGSEQSPSSQESIVMYSCFNASADGGTGIAQAGNYQQVSRGAFGGTWFAKAYGSFKATPWYKVTLQGLYIGDTTKHGNTLGYARKAPYTITAPLKDDNDIGWEFNIINEIDIYKNLKFFAGAGILIAGDGLDVWRRTDAGTAGANYSPKNPWNVTTRLLYSF